MTSTRPHERTWPMQRFHWAFALGVFLAVAEAARAQVIGGTLYVNNTHMS